jgi:hypothetical protein
VTAQHGGSPAVGAVGESSCQHEGRLGYFTGGGPRSVVVLYAVCAGRLVFRLPEYSSALGYAPNQPVTMQVSARDEQGTRTGDLLVSGTASLVEDDSCAVAEAVLDEQWPDGVVTRVLALPSTRVQLIPVGRPHDDLSARAPRRTAG